MNPENSLLSELESNIGYSFQDQTLLESALIHKSYGFEERVAGLRWVDNERLEFLGDAVLELIISELLMEQAPEKSEGELSRLRAALVNEGSLATIALEIGIPRFLRLGKGEERSFGREKPSILADAYEALIAAVYYDRGLEEAKRVVRLHFDDFFNEISRLDESFDFKTRLQEICQRRKKLLPVYKVVKEEGPDHQKSFHVEVSFDGETLAFGMGKSKKDAEQMAASQAIRVFDEL
ncbi:MAG: ribonuclease III [Deltaproteobacteria bacterium RIFCSPHIGHO2_12_FULL_43_9]|nr:MAG: ribonuclease III [Deltaproteobacteria bacterium RIFCSPHIGHO2_12_FULL_43_9]